MEPQLDNKIDDKFSQIPELKNLDDPVASDARSIASNRLQSELSKIQKIHWIDIGKMDEMKQKLKSSKIFFNMIIHDMRGPVNSMKLGLEQTLDILNSMQQSLIMSKDIIHNQKVIDKLFRENDQAINNLRFNQNQAQDPYQKNHVERLQILHDSINQYKKGQESNKDSFFQQIDEIQKQSIDMGHFLELMKFEAPEYNINHVSYQETEINEIDERFFENVINDSFFSANRQKIAESKVSQQSKALQEKKANLITDITELLENYQLKVRDDQNYQIVQQFVQDIFQKIEKKQIEKHKPEMLDGTTQTTIFESQLLQMREILASQQMKINTLVETQEENFKIGKLQLEKQEKELKHLKLEIDEEMFQKTIYARDQEIVQSFIKTCLKDIKRVSNEAITNLQHQVYSQEMMEGLINDMLDQAKIDNDVFKLNSQYFDLPMVVFKALNIIKTKATFNKIKLIAEVENPEHLSLLSWIEGDQQRYLQILNNFLSNSLKFTPENGTIRVVIRVKDHQLIENFHQSSNVRTYRSQELSRGNKLRVGQERFINLQISIIDTGMGITSEGVEKLFLDFGKLDENANHNRQGTGLGLSICKKIAEQMNGKVSVQSQVRMGTSFDFNINTKCKIIELKDHKNLRPQDPSLRANHPVLPDFLSEKLNSHVFIIKENNKPQIEQNLFRIKENRLKQISSNVLKHYISKQKELINHITLRQNVEIDKWYNSIDLHQFRNAIGSHFPLVQHQSQNLSMANKRGIFNLINSFQMAESRNNQEESKQSVREEVVQDMILEEARDSEELDSQIVVNAEFNQKVKCLVVNDCQMQLLVLSSVLVKMGFDVQKATNGFEALRMVQGQLQGSQASYKSTFAFILMDLNMPISNGYETCQNIRSFFASNKTIHFRHDVTVNLNLKDICPIIAACTSENVNHPAIAEKIANANFDLTMESPISQKHLNDVLLPHIERRKIKIERQIENIFEYEQFHQSINVNKKPWETYSNLFPVQNHEIGALFFPIGNSSAQPNQAQMSEIEFSRIMNKSQQ